MFSQNLIDTIYQAIKESGLNGSVYVNTETLEVSKYMNGLKIFFSGDTEEEGKDKARIELALLDYYE